MNTSENYRTRAVRDTTRGSRNQTKPRTISALFRAAIKSIVDPKPPRRRTATDRHFVRTARKITRDRAEVASLQPMPRGKNTNSLVLLAKSAAHAMTSLARAIENGLGFGPSHEEIERREQCAAARQRALEEAEELERYWEELRLLTAARAAGRPDIVIDKSLARFHR